MYVRKFVVVFSCLAICLAGSGPRSFARTDRDFKGVKAHCIIQATQAEVYRALRSMRRNEVDGIKQLKKSDNETLLVEVFDGLPIIGQAVCLYRETYTPTSRIDFELIESDRFKAFEGAWVLTPTGGGACTRLELSTYISTGLKLPFADRITNLTTMKGVKERLADVQKIVREQCRATRTVRASGAGKSL